MSTQWVAISDIVTDAGTQSRVALNDDTVQEYAERVRAGDVFPPVVVFNDGSRLLLADGFHRLHAHRHAESEKIECDVRTGTLRDAMLHALGSNEDNGLRRTNADKRRCVRMMLEDERVSCDADGNPWSGREIARRCKVDEGTVRRVKADMESSLRNFRSEPAPTTRTYTTKHGTTATMDTTNIGKRSKPAAGGISPNASRPVIAPNEPDQRRRIQAVLVEDVDAVVRLLFSTFDEAFCGQVADRIHEYAKERQDND